MVGYAFQNYDSKKMVRVAGTSLSISRKTSRDIGAFIKNRKVDWAISYLEKVAAGDAPVPYAKFQKKTAHHAPFGPAGYPRKASLEIISLLNSLRSNAQSKGMNTTNLTVIHTAAHKGARIFHPGGRERKNTGFEIVAQEIEVKNNNQKMRSEKQVAT